MMNNSKSRILIPKAFKSNKVHFKKMSLKVQASEKTQFIESDSQNGTKSGILERSICLEMNESESLSENSE